MIKKLLALTVMSAFLSGCFGSSTSDLKNFVEDAKARMPKKLEPLPMIPQVMRLA
jgi:Tfp pilus assembly protein PilP